MEQWEETEPGTTVRYQMAPSCYEENMFGES